ncbi:unnamed protein product [Psylliodes chrysocephalus]|uniref:DUF4817 domain-containing protein n=1 Tax=Psylliodes chrysocephalus TaxID=3402493 RepID=A0A9P0GKT5_9CUCU|nr:unnamed protein product [Psylliodes chrysocephala]
MSTDGKMKIASLRNNRGAFTREQKLVMTVWFHERMYTGMSYNQLCINFQIRFQTKPPTRNVLRIWDQKLFKDGFFFRVPGERPSSYLPRLVHIPYVLESFLRFPDLLETSRANMLGIHLNSLRSILKMDISPQEVEQCKQKGREKAVSGSSNTTSSHDESSSSKEDNCEENDSVEIEPVGVEEDFTVEFNSDEDEGNLETQVVCEEIIIKSDFD